MNKIKWIKVITVLLFVVLAGIFYSCRTSREEQVSLITDSLEEAVKDDTVQRPEEIIDIQTMENTEITEDTSELSNVNNLTNNNLKEAASTSNSAGDYIYVYICGEVMKPDVYKVNKETRVFEVIDAAGGLTDAAAGAYINQASKVSDGQQIYIPSIDEAADLLPAVSGITGDITENVGGNSLQLVNINIASASELMTLSGIGQAKAQAIIDYRISNGGFKSIDEIKKIDGIKDAVFNKIKDKICVG